MTELLSRFLIGGVGVSVFAAVGSSFEPKTFAGLFGSAPPIALVSLALAFQTHSDFHIRELARSMVLGAAALFAYATLCVVICRVRRLSVFAGAVLAWGGWGLVAFTLFRLFVGGAG